MLVPSKALSTRRISVRLTSKGVSSPSLQASSRISGERALAALRRVRGLWVNGGFFATKRGVLTSDVDIDNNLSSNHGCESCELFQPFFFACYFVPGQGTENVCYFVPFAFSASDT